MKKVELSLSLALGLFLAACSTDDPSGAQKSFGGSIEGVSQKGPVLVGSSVTLQELDGKSLLQTGKSFKGSVLNDKGEFTIEDVNLESPFVLLEVNGYFRNEVTGNKSNGPVFMKALADIKGEPRVNINLLTHLEYERVQVLMEQKELSIAQAKREADREIFAAFYDDGDYDNVEHLNIFGNGEGDAALLAINVLLLGDDSEADFMERFAKLGEDLAADGVWNDSLLKAEVADFACEVSLAGRLSEIRSNIAAWKIGNVPAFEPYVNRFWEDLYGLGKCDVSNAGQGKKVKYAASRFDGLEFTCGEGGTWVANVGGRAVGCDTCRTVKDSRDGHVYRVVDIGGVNWMGDDLRYDNGSIECFRDDCKNGGFLYTGDFLSVCPEGWRVPTHKDFYRLLQSTSADGFADLLAKAGWNATTGALDEDAHYWSSSYRNLSATPVLIYAYEWLTLSRKDSLSVGLSFADASSSYEQSLMTQGALVRCVEDVPDSNQAVSPNDVVQGTFVDSRDERTYRTITLGNQVWFAENLNYDLGDSVETSCLHRALSTFSCSGYNPACYDTTCNLGRGYTWSVAQNVCPEGWRLPDRADVELLLESVGGAAEATLVLGSGFRESTDDYGFSVLGTSYDSGKYYSYAVAADFWTADSTSDGPVLWSFDAYDASLGEADGGIFSPVRCIKN
jgi:uncharacterized protein (TIGR02145 family)